MKVTKLLINSSLIGIVILLVLEVIFSRLKFIIKDLEHFRFDSVRFRYSRKKKIL